MLKHRRRSAGRGSTEPLLQSRVLDKHNAAAATTSTKDTRSNRQRAPEAIRSVAATRSLQVLPGSDHRRRAQAVRLVEKERQGRSSPLSLQRTRRAQADL